MEWYTFSSREAFDTWHEALKAELGYPLPSIDKEGNVIGEPYTTEYTSVVEVAPDDWRTIAHPEYAEGLEASTEPVFPDERVIDGNSEAL
jgi:hypothetical protein